MVVMVAIRKVVLLGVMVVVTMTMLMTLMVVVVVAIPMVMVMSSISFLPNTCIENYI